MESNFKAIETQEELDKIIQKRLAQKDRELAETYKDFLSPEKAAELKADFEKQLEDSKKSLEEAKARLADHDKIVSDLKQRAEAAEVKNLKTKIVNEVGLRFELADRLVGNTEDELKADAEALKALVEPQKTTAPLATRDILGGAPKTTNTDASMLTLLGQLNEQMQANN